jgi:predicted O-methyltransferase YrrM
MGPALETLETIDCPLDFVFLDADKANYTRYYEKVVPLLRPGGWIAADNTLWSGRVLEEAQEQEEDTRALVAFSRHVAADDRVDQVLLTVRDGITLIWRK